MKCTVYSNVQLALYYTIANPPTSLETGVPVETGLEFPEIMKESSSIKKAASDVILTM